MALTHAAAEGDSTNPRLNQQLHITVQTMAGTQCKPGPFQPEQTVLDLKRGIRACWGIPVSQQNLILGTQIFQDDTEHLRVALGDGVDHSLYCMAKKRSEEEQATLDDKLVLAVAKGDKSNAAELLREEAKTNLEEGSEGPAPLLFALAACDEDMAALLRKHGAEEQSIVPKTNSLPDALSFEDVEDILRHIAAGADVNVRLTRGQGIRATSTGVPLHACCAMHRKRGVLALALILIRRGADCQAGDSEGDTPLAHAKYFGSREMFDILQEAGAKIDGPFYRRYQPMPGPGAETEPANQEEDDFDTHRAPNWRYIPGIFNGVDMEVDGDDAESSDEEDNLSTSESCDSPRP